MQIEDLSAIFVSRPGHAVPDRQALNDIKFLIDNDYLQVSKHFFCDKKTFTDTLGQLLTGKVAIFDFDGGKMEHMALKAITQRSYAKNMHAHIEESFMGRIPDVLFRESGIIRIVECGNTDPRKIFEYFNDPNVVEVSILPFPYADDEYLYIYNFMPSEDLQEFLAFWEEEKRQNIKNVIRKR